eukprot:SAG31_NODE_33249_length_346_cov_0.619433_1_plen_50_part_10
MVVGCANPSKVTASENNLNSRVRNALEMRKFDYTVFLCPALDTGKQYSQT